MEYASKATGGTALGLGIAGTAGWLLNGGLGNLFGGLGGNGVVAPAVAGLAADRTRRTARSRTPIPNLRTAFSALPARCARTRKSRPL